MVDLALFFFHKDFIQIFPLLYLDNILITGTSPSQLQKFLKFLKAEFAIKNLEHVHYFLWIEISTTKGGLILSQQCYAEKTLEKARMTVCKPISMPLAKPSSNVELFQDATLYRALVGSHHYLTFTRPNPSFVVNFVCQFMHQPSVYHFNIIKKTLRYLKGTPTKLSQILLLSLKHTLRVIGLDVP